MADKKTSLSIVINAVDNATAKIKAINARLDASTKPMRDFKSALTDLRSKSGLDDVISGFKGVGSAIGGVLAKIGLIGGVVGVAVAGMFKLVDSFDDLGDKAEAMGVSVDFLAQLRYAAERSGASVEALDGGLKTFTVGIGQARAGTGRFAAFLKNTHPELLKQLKLTKSNEAAFSLLATAAGEIENPANRAAFAQKAFGDASLAPLLSKGAKGIQELRDRYFGLAGSQKEAAEKAGEVDDSLKDFKATTDGVKAALVRGLGPALKVIVDLLSKWFSENREKIAAWANEIGERLPAAFRALVEWIKKAYDKVSAFVESIGGLKNAAIGVGLILAGPLISSLVGLGGALISAVSRVGSLVGAFGSASAAAGGFGSKVTALLGPIGLAIAAAGALNEITGGSIEGGAMGLAKRELARRKGKIDAADAKAIDLSVREMAAQRGNVSGQASAIAAGRSSSTETKITVDVNGPPGTRASVDPTSTGDVDLTTGINMFGLGSL